MIGAGIVIISKWPIINATYTGYNLTGKHYKAPLGDTITGKGIGHCVIQAPFGAIDVFSTHAHAVCTFSLPPTVGQSCLCSVLLVVLMVRRPRGHGCARRVPAAPHLPNVAVGAVYQ